MSTAIHDTWSMTVRELLKLWRQPWWIAVTLVQPVIWLLLFGALFEGITALPGFGGDDYTQYLTPGIVMMTAFFSAGWSGMPMIEDLQKGVMDRLLVTPVRRGPLIGGRLLQGALVIVIQSLIIVGLALAVGASFPGGVPGVLVLIVIAAMLGTGWAALSNGLALVTRQEETLIGVLTFLMLPLSFLSTTFLPEQLMPDWIASIAKFNPLNWAVVAGREALAADPDWGEVALQGALVLAFMAAAFLVATRAFRAYQRSV